MFHDIVHGLNHILNKNKELTEIYVAVALRKFAVAMFGIFVPIYLFFELNYSLAHIGVFFVVTYFSAAISFILASKISENIGFKKNLLISSIILIFALTFLYLLKMNAVWFYPSSVLFGAAQAMFWFSVHADMAKSIKKKKGGSEVSWIFIMVSIASIIGPFLAGLILDLSGFDVLFVVVTAILILSSTPLFLTRDIKLKTNINFRSLFSKDDFRCYLSYFSDGAMHVATAVFWPLFVFFILNNYLGFGIIFSLISVVTPFILVFAGRYVDHNKLRIVLSTGAIIFGISIIMRSFVENISGVVIVTLLGAISWALFTVAMHKSLYMKVRSNGDKNYSEIITRELILNVGRIFILLFFIFSGSFFWSFIVAGLTSLVFLFTR
jgi:MFS family permease